MTNRRATLLVPTLLALLLVAMYTTCALATPTTANAAMATMAATMPEQNVNTNPANVATTNAAIERNSAANINPVACAANPSNNAPEIAPRNAVTNRFYGANVNFNTANKNIGAKNSVPAGRRGVTVHWAFTTESAQQVVAV